MTQMPVEAVPVNSTLLARMSYEVGAALLYLEFCDGAFYCYRGVPREIYEGILIAHSKGAYFNRQIRGCFEYVLLRRPQ
jgi:hypothetical protein